MYRPIFKVFIAVGCVALIAIYCTAWTSIYPSSVPPKEWHSEHTHLEERRNEPIKIDLEERHNEPTKVDLQEKHNEPTKVGVEEKHNEPSKVAPEERHNEPTKVGAKEKHNEPIKVAPEERHNEPTKVGAKEKHNEPIEVAPEERNNEPTIAGLKERHTEPIEECRGCSRGQTTGGDVMVAISLFNKIGYTRFTSLVIRDYQNITETDIHLFDDCSTQYSEGQLREWYGKGVHYFRTEKSQGLGANVKRMIDQFVSSNYKILFLIDGETIFLPNWLEFIKKNINKSGDGFLSLYHSSVNHNYSVDCENPVGNLCGADAFGTLGVALTHSVGEKLSKKNANSFENLNWTTILQNEGIEPLYPLKSLTMQIGQTNQGEDNCGENEVAYRFDRCALPDWIKNGITFYFDRCTRPDEIYYPEHSMQDIEKEGRFWTRPAISYSFYGSRRRYTQIARENAARVFSVYPGWKIWIYSDNSVPKPIVRELCEFDIRFIDVSQTKIKSKMTWRFLVASELVKVYAVRDIDSWLLPRGKAAVDEWIKSGRKFHVLRDHPNHSRYPMSGGMWGGTHDAIPNMKDLLESRQLNNNYMADMNFLNGVIWKIASQSVWVHDSHSLHKFGEDHPFPTKQKSRELFVGNVVIWPG